MKTVKASVVVSLCLAACLIGLVVAHIQLRQEVAGLRRSVHLAILARTDIPEVSTDDIESLNSELRKITYRLYDLDSKADADSLEDLKEEVGRLRGSVLEARVLIERIPDSPDIVKRYELNGEIMDLEKRIKSIEDALRIRRY